MPLGSQIVFSLYFIMTGIHALHMVVGIVLMSVILIMALQRRFSPEDYGPVEASGLYWHFVDIVWIFLFCCICWGSTSGRPSENHPCPRLTSHPFAPTSRSGFAWSRSPSSRCWWLRTTSSVSTQRSRSASP
jgi:Cytochrome c oxidase subunit III